MVKSRQKNQNNSILRIGPKEALAVRQKEHSVDVMTVLNFQI